MNKKRTTTTATTISNGISMDMVEFLQKKQHFPGAVELLTCTHLKLAGPLLFLSHEGQGVTLSPPPCRQGGLGLSSSAGL